MPKFKGLNALFKKNRRITKTAFVAEIVTARNAASAKKKLNEENMRWNKFSRKTHRGQGIRTRTVKIVKVGK